MNLKPNYLTSLLLAALALTGAMTSPAAAYVEGITYHDVFVSGTGDYDTYRIPSIVKCNDGTLLAFAEGRKNSTSDSGNIDIVLSRSTDNGFTWSTPQLVWSNGNGVAGNPCPVVDQATGNVILVSNHQTAGVTEAQIRQGVGERTYQVQMSSNSGLTWSSPTLITAIEAIDPYWIAGGPNHGLQLQRGEAAGRIVIAGNHSVYTTVTKSPDYFAANELHTIYSDDGGLTWELGAVSGDTGDIYVSEVAATELPDGSLYFTVRDQHGAAAGNRGFTTSYDAGESFGPLYMDSTIITPICQGSILEYSAVDLGDSRNRVLMSYPVSATNTRENLSVRSSFDNCQTWTSTFVIYDGLSAYADMVRTANNQVGVLFERDNYAAITFATFLPELLDGDEDTDTWSSDYANTILADHPIAYYRMDESYGTVLHDVSGNELHGIRQGAGTLTYDVAHPLAQDFDNRAMSFDGNTSFTVADNALLDFGTDRDFSVEFWFKTTPEQATDGQSVFFNKGDTNASVWGRLYNGQVMGKLDYGSTEDGLGVDYATATDGEWHQYVFVADRDTAFQIYIDGVLIGEDTTIVGGNIDNDFVLDIAKMVDKYFLGEMDEFAIFGEALTPAQILAHYYAAVRIPGDANEDGVVDGSDATILAGYWQQGNATWEMGDFNGDHVVDGSDATILAGYWQSTINPGTTPEPTVVPEPSTALLLLATLAGLLVIRFARR